VISDPTCGFAAAQCGEALPHRCISKIDWRLRLGFMRHSLKKKKWTVGKAEPFRTVRRQSRVPGWLDGKEKDVPRHLIGSGKQALVENSETISPIRCLTVGDN